MHSVNHSRLNVEHPMSTNLVCLLLNASSFYVVMGRGEESLTMQWIFNGFYQYFGSYFLLMLFSQSLFTLLFKSMEVKCKIVIARVSRPCFSISV